MGAGRSLGGRRGTGGMWGVGSSKKNDVERRSGASIRTRGGLGLGRAFPGGPGDYERYGTPSGSKKK